MRNKKKLYYVYIIINTHRVWMWVYAFDNDLTSCMCVCVYIVLVYFRLTDVCVFFHLFRSQNIFFSFEEWLSTFNLMSAWCLLTSFVNVYNYLFFAYNFHFKSFEEKKEVIYLRSVAVRKVALKFFLPSSSFFCHHHQ